MKRTVQSLAGYLGILLGTLLAPGAARAWGVPAPPHAAETSGVEESRRICDAVMKRSPVLTDRWHYDVGLVLSGFEAVWRRTGDRRYLDYVKSNVDRLVGPGGVIKGYDPKAYMLDDVNMGKVLFALYADSKNDADRDRYGKAIRALRAQLAAQPRTADGGFWHKQVYPHQMWADGVYMASPFLAKFAAAFNDPAALDEAVKQVLLAETHLRDDKTGLLFHGWDETKKERWADPATGRSSQLWGRGDGWYAMAVVDVLAEMPKDHPKRKDVLGVLRRLARAIAAVQDKTTGVWWQVLDAADRPGNYREASVSAMFAYALTRGFRNGWLDTKTFQRAAARGYAGTVKEFVVADATGDVHVTRICKVAGLGGEPYRDGSYDYYIGTEVVTDDPKGVGAFILAGAEQP